jgi:2-oxoisovalerate dehydrogenase E1 component
MVVASRHAPVDTPASTPSSTPGSAGCGARFLAFVVEAHPFAWAAARKAWARFGVETRDPDALAALGATVARALVDELPTPDRGLPETQPFVDAGTRHAQEVAALARDIDGFFAREAIAASITDDEKRWMLRGIILTRAVDNKMKQLFLSSEMTYGDRGFQGKGFRSLGQEAIYAGALRLRRGRAFERPAGTTTAWTGDVAGPLIRDLGFTLAFVDDHDDGVTACLNAQVGKAGLPGDGRDLHLGMPARGVLMVAAPLAIATGTVTGAALAFARAGEDRVAVSFIGEGGSSLGEWHESVNFAAVQKLPVIFCLENNQTALSTPLAHQSRTRTFADKARGYGIPAVTVDGTDAVAVAAAFAWAADRARAGHGPTLIETVAMRMCGHAHHDDMLYLGGDPPLSFEIPPTPDKGYVDRNKYAAWLERDPLARLAAQLKEQGVVDDRQVLAWQAEAQRRVDDAAAILKARPWADGATVGVGVTGDAVVVRGPAVAVPALPTTSSTTTTTGAALRVLEPAPEFHPKGSTFLDACGQGLLEVLDALPQAFVLGEDVAPPYGNAFLLLKPLLERHGDRLLNTPIAENAIVGACVGAALMGQRPIGEIQFNDFVASGFNPLVNNAAKLRYRAGTPVPMTLRMPWGGLRRAGPYHSQDTTPWFFRTFGLKIAVPSTPHDARALLWSAVVDDDPVLFYEHIALYRDPRIKQLLPGDRPTIPLGQAAFRRLGDDLTLLAYGAYVHKAAAVADALAAEGASCDVLDLRSLVPLDWARIEASVRHTGKVLLVGEDSRTGSVLESIASRIGESLYEHLDGPVRVLGALDTPVPYSPSLEDAFLLSDEHILQTARALLSW